MQRWGKPEATIQKFAKPHRPNNIKPDPVSFYIDHAPQDRKVAAELSKKLQRYEHPLAPDYRSAKAVFVLISRFKSDTEADPEQQVVYPVMVQTAEVSEKLSHVQWIDFRKGLRNLDAVAQLLPNPANMLAALGSRPVDGKQIVTPNIINTIANFLIVNAVFDIAVHILILLMLLGRNIFSALASQGESVTGILVHQTITSTLFVFITFFLVRGLRQRNGSLASIGAFFFAQFVLFLTLFWQAYQDSILLKLLETYQLIILESDVFVIIIIPFYFYIIGSFFIGLAALFRIRDLIRWFPAGAK